MLSRRVGVGAPVPVPARVHQDGCAAYVAIAKPGGVEATPPLRTGGGAHHEALEIGDGLERITGDVLCSLVTVEGGVDVGTGVRQQLDLADLESRAGSVASARRVARQPIADRGREQPAVRDHPVFDLVAEVYE